MLKCEQRENDKFRQKSVKSTSKTFQMSKQVYGEEAFDHSAVLKWHKCFAQGRGSSEDDGHAGRPRAVRTELKIQKVAKLAHVNRSQTVDEVTAAAVISRDNLPQNSV
jgi:hypothetical protein